MAAAQWPNPGSAPADFFYSANKTEFSATTTPAATWGLRMYNISAIADTMAFSVGTGVVAIHETVPGGFASGMSYCNSSPVYNLLGVQTGIVTAGQSVLPMTRTLQSSRQSFGSGMYIVPRGVPKYGSKICPVR